MPHLYFDQGGLFGDATYLITDNKLPQDHEDENNICYFYYCEAPPHIINNILFLFQKTFPDCKLKEITALSSIG